MTPRQVDMLAVAVLALLIGVSIGKVITEVRQEIDQCRASAPAPGATK